MVKIRIDFIFLFVLFPGFHKERVFFFLCQKNILALKGPLFLSSQIQSMCAHDRDVRSPDFEGGQLSEGGWQLSFHNQRPGKLRPVSPHSEGTLTLTGFTWGWRDTVRKSGTLSR